jgi:hypothetical protein
VEEVPGSELVCYSLPRTDFVSKFGEKTEGGHQGVSGGVYKTSDGFKINADSKGDARS